MIESFFCVHIVITGVVSDSARRISGTTTDAGVNAGKSKAGGDRSDDEDDGAAEQGSIQHIDDENKSEDEGSEGENTATDDDDESVDGSEGEETATDDNDESVDGSTTEEEDTASEDNDESVVGSPVQMLTNIPNYSADGINESESASNKTGWISSLWNMVSSPGSKPSPPRSPSPVVVSTPFPSEYFDDDYNTPKKLEAWLKNHFFFSDNSNDYRFILKHYFEKENYEDFFEVFARAYLAAILNIKTTETKKYNQFEKQATNFLKNNIRLEDWKTKRPFANNVALWKYGFNLSSGLDNALFKDFWEQDEKPLLTEFDISPEEFISISPKEKTSPTYFTW